MKGMKFWIPLVQIKHEHMTLYSMKMEIKCLCQMVNLTILWICG